MRKKWKLTLCLSFMVVCICTIWLYTSRDNTTNDPNEEVLSMYGEKVALGEFKVFLNDSVGTVFQYFSEKYKATDSPTFWTTSFQGEIPIEKAKQQTLEKLKVIKAEQVL